MQILISEAEPGIINTAIFIFSCAAAAAGVNIAAKAFFANKDKSEEAKDEDEEKKHN